MRVNGNLTLNTDGSGTLQDLFVEKGAYGPGGVNLPAMSGLPGGRVIFNTSDTSMYVWNGQTWNALAVGTTAVTSFATTLSGLTPSTATGGAIVLSGTLGAASGGTGVANAASSTITLGAALTTTGGALTFHAQSGGSSVVVPTSGTLLSTTDVGVFVSSFSGGTTGLTPVTATTGAITLAGTLAVANGGTGATTFTTDGILYGNGTGAIQATAAGAQYNVLTVVASGAPEFGQVDLAQSAAVTGILAPANGGTGVANTSTLTLGGNLTTSGAFASTFTMSATTNVTFPTSGTLLSTSGSNYVSSFAQTTSSLSLTTSGATTAATGAVATTVNLNAMLDAFGQLAGTGIIAQTGASTFSEVTITGTAGDIVVTNGNGVSGNPTIDLAAVAQSTGSNFVKITLDGFGRVTGNTLVSQADLTSLISTYYLPGTGGTMTGNITMSGGATVTGLPTPTASSDAVNKSYVDAAVTNINIHDSADVLADSTNTSIINNSTYTNGTADTEGGLGIGATLTDSTTGTVLVVDGVTVALGNRILVAGFTTTSAKYNGIYDVTTLGVAGTTPWVLTRSSDYNDSTLGEVIPGDFTFIVSGTQYASTGWVETAKGTSTVTTDAIVIGTDAITFTQFAGAGTYLAGTGLTLSGTTFSLTSPVDSTLGGTGTTIAPTAGQILIGTSTGEYVAAALASGSGISTTTGSGTLQINNTGVLSLASSLTGINVSSATGAVTLSGTLGSASGGTGSDNSAGAVGTVLAAETAGVYTAQQMMYYATGAFTASTPATITHNLNQEYVLVQIYDTTGTSPSQIIPDSVVLSNANAIAVTLTQSLASALVVVVGLAGASNGTF